MRHRRHLFAILITLAGVYCACGTGTPSGATSGSGGKPAFGCHDVYLFNDPCDACLANHCCEDLLACSLSPDCIYCAETDEFAALCTREPQWSLSTAIHTCGWGYCEAECAIYGRALGPDPNDPVTKFCATAGEAYCEAYHACCAGGGTLEDCKAQMTGPGCLGIEGPLHLDDSYQYDDDPTYPVYGLRRMFKDGRVVLDQAQLDACIAGLQAMTAGGAACTAAVPDFFRMNCMTAFKGQIALGEPCLWHSGGNYPGLTYAFIPCKEGRCVNGTCTPFPKVGDMCSPKWPGNDGPGACDYLHGDGCYVDLGMSTWACGHRKEIGEACDPMNAWPECKSGNCEDTKTCAPATPTSACYVYE